MTGVAIWGNHSSTQFPDFENARIGAEPAPEVIDDTEWLQGEFITTVQQRGAQIIEARGRVVGGVGGQRRGRLGAQHRHTDGRRRLRCRWRWSPTASTAPPRASSSGSRSAPTARRGTVVEGLDHSDFADDRIRVTTEELESERAAVRDLLG